MKNNLLYTDIDPIEWLKPANRYVGDLAHQTIQRLGEPVVNYQFHSQRAWGLDLAWPKEKIAAECHGSTWTGGRHVSGTGFAEDRRKMNCAALMGWRVFEFTPTEIQDGAALQTLELAFASTRNPEPLAHEKKLNDLAIRDYRPKKLRHKPRRLRGAQVKADTMKSRRSTKAACK